MCVLDSCKYSLISSYKQEKMLRTLAISLVSTVMKILRNAKLPQKKIEVMSRVYDFIKDHSDFVREKDKDGNPGGNTFPVPVPLYCAI